MRVTVRGKRWALRFTALRKCHGSCESPTTKRKEIRINSKLKGVKLLDTLVHELLHAGGWDMSEEWVHEMGTDIAKALWDLGYRRKT